MERDQYAESSDMPCGRVFHSATAWNNGMYRFGWTIDSMSNNQSGVLYQFCFSTFPKCSLVNDLTCPLKHEDLCDIHFLLKDRAVVKAHIVIVASRSPYLRKKILEQYLQTQGGDGSDSSQESPGRSVPPFLIEKPIELSLQDVGHEMFKLAFAFPVHRPNSSGLGTIPAREPLSLNPSHGGSLQTLAASGNQEA